METIGSISIRKMHHLVKSFASVCMCMCVCMKTSIFFRGQLLKYFTDSAHGKHYLGNRVKQIRTHFRYIGHYIQVTRVDC